MERFAVRIPPDAGPLETALLEALQELVDGDAQPASASAVRRPVRPNRKAVAETAGLHRNVISGRRSAYPHVVEEIRRAQRHVDLERRSSTVRREVEDRFGGSILRRDNAELRERNADLTAQRNAAYTSAACCTILARALERADRMERTDLQTVRRLAETIVLSSAGPPVQSQSDSRPELKEVVVRD